MRIEEAIKFAEHAQTMTDIPEVKEFYAMAEKALRTQNQVNWMSVKDRLPEPDVKTIGRIETEKVIASITGRTGNGYGKKFFAWIITNARDAGRKESIVEQASFIM